MLQRLPKLFLVATSLAPVLLTLAFLEFRAHELWWALGYLIATLVLVQATTALLNLCKMQLGVIKVKLFRAKTSDREVIGFLLAYVLPLALTGSVAAKPDGWSLLYLVVLFGAVVWGTHAYDFNPLLGLIGYHFYEVEVEGGITYVVISKRTIVDVQQVTEVVQLTEYVLLDKN